MSSNESITARRWVRRSTSEFGHDRSPTHPERVLRFRRHGAWITACRPLTTAPKGN